MRIITVSREFGSGGRELGSRLAAVLGWDYYDKEIIEVLAAEHGMDEDDVREVLNNHGWSHIQLTYRSSFSHMMFHPGSHLPLLLRQKEIIREIADSGHDCVIVGRDAAVILHDFDPFRIFVCADMEARLARTMAYELRKPEGERLSEKEIRKNIRRIDRARVRTREVLTGKSGSDHSTFDLTINASGKDLKKLAGALAQFSEYWFTDRKEA